MTMNKTWTAPNGFRKVINLSVGKAEVRVSHGMDTVDSKVYLTESRYKQLVFIRLYKGLDNKGKYTVKQRVQATSIRMKLPDGTVVQSRSCCKYPDVFDPITGVRLAAQRLIKGKCGGLSNEDRILLRTVLNDSAKTAYTPVVESKKRIAAASRKSD